MGLQYLLVSLRLSARRHLDEAARGHMKWCVSVSSSQSRIIIPEIMPLVFSFSFQFSIFSLFILEPAEPPQFFHIKDCSEEEGGGGELAALYFHLVFQVRNPG